MSASNATPIESMAYSLDVLNSFACPGVERQLPYVDVTGPEAPLQVAELQESGDSVHDIQVVGDLAFMATRAMGRHIDVFSPAQFFKIGSSKKFATVVPAGGQT